ncbi:MAG TPA: hypothetical protein VFG04_05130, partial [Planctomycetaceae bacterium]|nr:hypothetical protein [Planctomycetaceae bacterium]
MTAVKPRDNLPANPARPLRRIIAVPWLCLLMLNALPFDVADQRQLFFDRRFIAESQRVELHTNPAQKIGMIL